ncbi:MAG: hypothetical protein HYZ63_00795 [Candidatus Andersenbacteria bacterium]|nr:hypothetical protein [Candidatus Andersenbacteria bacterium]
MPRHVGRRANQARIEKNMVTKQGLEKFATKDDVKGFATKQDLERFATKDDVTKQIKASEKRIIFEFKALAENIHNDLAGANKDEISSIKDKVKEHSTDIAIIKEKVGILS